MLRKYLVILLSAASMAMCAVGCGKSDDADMGNTSLQRSGASAKETSDEIVDGSDTFAVADELNANSNTVLKVLDEAEYVSDKCYYTDGPISVLAYDDEVVAYAFDYPENSDTGYWTQIGVTDSSLNVFGIHPGDDADCIENVMDKYGYELIEINSERQKYNNSDSNCEYRKGDLHIFFYMNENEIVEIYITVHEDKKHSGVIY